MSDVAAISERASWQVPSFDVLFARPMRHAVCVVIPVINEGERIRNLLMRITAIDAAARADVIIIDGGSTDGSLDHGWLQDHGVDALLRKTAPGKLSAQLRCAYAFALDRGYQGVVTIDGNDKDDPQTIGRFVDALEQGVDFVQASRFIAGGKAKNTPVARDLAIRLIHAPLLRWCSGFHWTDTTQGFRAYSRKMLLDPRVAPFRDVFMTYELLAYLSLRVPQLGFHCTELPATRIYPPGEVPTKISSLRGNLDVFATLLRACAGCYNTKKS